MTKHRRPKAHGLLGPGLCAALEGRAAAVLRAGMATVAVAYGWVVHEVPACAAWGVPKPAAAAPQTLLWASGLGSPRRFEGGPGGMRTGAPVCWALTTLHGAADPGVRPVLDQVVLVGMPAEAQVPAVHHGAAASAPAHQPHASAASGCGTLADTRLETPAGRKKRLNAHPKA